MKHLNRYSIKKTFILPFSILAMIFLTSISITANNIRVTNISLGTNDYVNKSLEVNFDLAWDNSWRTSTLESNWDAAWIILKYKVEDPNNPYYFSHCKLKSTGHTAASGSVIDVANGLQGAMIYRDADGIGNVDFMGMTIVWDYGADFLGGFEALEVQVIATEMVYIPGGAFYVGDASTTTEGRLGDGTGNPFQITSEAALTLGGAGSNLNSFWTGTSTDDFDAVTTQSLPADYPKGFDPFYIMKYELSVDQMVTTMNATRSPNGFPAIGSGGNQIQEPDFNNPYYYTFFPFESYYSISFYTALYDWYGMRVMSELEFEKICRGSGIPVSNEFPWGDTYISKSPISAFDGSMNQDTANAIYSLTYPDGQFGNYPQVQVGYFANNANNSSRQITGGSFYGVLEMAGLYSEPVARIGVSSSRILTNEHGDGDLSTILYPSLAIGQRGGSFTSSVGELKTSGRNSSGSKSLRMVISDF